MPRGAHRPAWRARCRLLLALGLAPMAARAQEPDVPVDTAKGEARPPAVSFAHRGQYVQLFSQSRTLGGDGFWSDLQRLRLDFTVTVKEKLTIKAISDLEATVGSVLETSEFGLLQAQPPNGVRLIDADDMFLRQRFYRAFAAWQDGRLRLTLGRQRIPLGVSRFWSSVDVLNPLNPFSIEREERVGVDGVTGEWRFSPLSQLEIGYLPRRDSRETRFVGRYLAHVGGVDVSLTGVKAGSDSTFGLTAERNVKGAGLRLEGSYLHGRGRPDSQRVTVGTDYTFANSLYVALEYYYNGATPAELPASGIPAPTTTTFDHLDIARHNLGLSTSCELTPLLRGTVHVIQTARPSGLFITPMLSYNVRKQLDLSAGATLFSGRQGTPFGLAPNVYYLRADWFF